MLLLFQLCFLVRFGRATIEDLHIAAILLIFVMLCFPRPMHNIVHFSSYSTNQISRRDQNKH